MGLSVAPIIMFSNTMRRAAKILKNKGILAQTMQYVFYGTTLFVLCLGAFSKNEFSTFFFIAGSFGIGVINGFQLRDWTEILGRYDYQIISKISLISLICAAPVYLYVTQLVPQFMVAVVAGAFVIGKYALSLSRQREVHVSTYGENNPDARDQELQATEDNSLFKLLGTFKTQVISLVGIFAAFALLQRWQLGLQRESYLLLALTSAVLIALGSTLIYQLCFNNNIFRFSSINLFHRIFPMLITLAVASYYFGANLCFALSAVVNGLTFTVIALMPSTCIALSRKIKHRSTEVYSAVSAASFLSAAGILLILLVYPSFNTRESIVVLIIYLLALAYFLIMRDIYRISASQILGVPKVLHDSRQFALEKEERNSFQGVLPEIKNTENSGGDNDANEVSYKEIQRIFKLTNRETEILSYLVKGYQVSTIAKTLCLSENTIKTHCKNLYVKLDIHRREELVFLIDEMQASHQV